MERDKVENKKNNKKQGKEYVRKLCTLYELIN